MEGLNGLLDFIKTPEGQGLLAATFGGLAGAQRGAPINSIGRAGLAGISGYGNALEREQQTAQQGQMQKYRDQQMQFQQMQMDKSKSDMAQEAKLRDGISQFFKPGQSALAPLAGDASTGVLPSQGRSAEPPSIDQSGLGMFLAQNGKVNEGLALLKPKDAPINKLDVKDFTPASVATFAKSGNYGDLVRMDKLHFQDTGGSVKGLDPFTGRESSSVNKTKSFSDIASERSNALGWANHSLSKERLGFDKAGGGESIKPKLVGDQWVTAPTNMQPGQTVAAFPSVAKKDAQEALQIIKTAKEIIPRSTGSYLGAGVDQAFRFVGSSTGGDTAAAQLKALEGSLVSKMPKMSGPQSDKDVLLYKQMAGEIGNPTIPQSRKMAALKVIEEIQTRHAGGAPPANNAPMRGQVVDGHKFKGGDPADPSNWEKK